MSHRTHESRITRLCLPSEYVVPSEGPDAGLVAPVFPLALMQRTGWSQALLRQRRHLPFGNCSIAHGTRVRFVRRMDGEVLGVKVLLPAACAASLQATTP